ncbi:MAG: glycosyltransferase [bacterium]|nr:glycosyltransferase [bacterium]
MAAGLAGRGWNVRMLSLLPPRAFAGDLAEAGIPVVDLGLRGMSTLLPATARLHRELRRHRPDVLVAFNYHANVLGKIVGRLAGVRAIVPSIGTEFFGGRLRERIEALTAPLAPITTTNSELVGESLVRRGVVPRERLRIVLNATIIPDGSLDPARRSVLRDEMGGGERDLIWLAVGRFEPQKDYPNLFAAFSEIAARRPEARLALVGYGSLDAAVREMAKTSPAAERIRVLGKRNDVMDLLQASDAYVLSSVIEGMPNTVIEAMATALPIVATNVGGMAELLGGGECGFMVRPSDPGALAGAMAEVMALDPASRRAMGERARVRMRYRHGVEVVLDRWAELCREAAAGGGRRGDGDG